MMQTLRNMGMLLRLLMLLLLLGATCKCLLYAHSCLCYFDTLESTRRMFADVHLLCAQLF
jgi:hypothetical protein